MVGEDIGVAWDHDLHDRKADGGIGEVDGKEVQVQRGEGFFRLVDVAEAIGMADARIEGDDRPLEQDVVRKVPVSDHVIKYVTNLVGATRPSSPLAPELTKTYVSTGAGPRAGQCLILAAKATAILEGRIHVSCADIRRAAPPVLRHRLMTNFAADSEGLGPLDIVKKLLEIVPEPGAEAYPVKAAKVSK